MLWLCWFKSRDILCTRRNMFNFAILLKSDFKIFPSTLSYLPSLCNMLYIFTPHFFQNPPCPWRRYNSTLQHLWCSGIMGQEIHGAINAAGLLAALAISAWLGHLKMLIFGHSFVSPGFCYRISVKDVIISWDLSPLILNHWSLIPYSGRFLLSILWRNRSLVWDKLFGHSTIVSIYWCFS